MSWRLLSIIIGLIFCQTALAESDRSKTVDPVLLNRLKNLESQAIQRRGRAPTIVDLLRRQNDRLAGQALNTLKTKDVRNRNLPLLKRRLDRSRRRR